MQERPTYVEKHCAIRLFIHYMRVENLLIQGARSWGCGRDDHSRDKNSVSKHKMNKVEILIFIFDELFLICEVLTVPFRRSHTLPGSRRKG
jgi:hypothetical protein